MPQSILIADDSATIQQTARRALTELGFDVQVVSDGDSAVAALAEGEPRLVVADIHMPGQSGYEVARRAHQAGIPTVLLVGTFEPFDAAAFERCGAEACLKKPFEAERLQQEVAQWIEVPEAAPEPEPEPVIAAAEASDPEASDPQPGAESDPEPEARPEPEPEPERDPKPGREAGSDAERSDDDVFDLEPPILAAELAPDDEAAEPSSGGLRVHELEEPVVRGASLGPEEIEAIARRVVELAGADVVREVAWEVVPDLAEVVVRERLAELEAAADEDD